MGERAIRVMIVDGSSLARLALTRLLEAAPGIAVARAVADSRAALAFLTIDAPADVVYETRSTPGTTAFRLLVRAETSGARRRADFHHRLPDAEGPGGLAVIAELRARGIGSPVVVVSPHSERVATRAASPASRGFVASRSRGRSTTAGGEELAARPLTNPRPWLYP